MTEPMPQEISPEVPAREVYVGPRPFERSERGLFFGRDREISELLSLVVSSRAVLCYAPSGAGKTSLINAGLRPRLEEEGFEVLPSARVRGLIPDEIGPEQVSNPYAFNALLSLAGEDSAPSELADNSLAKFLSARPHLLDDEGFPAPRILIFDQFEELLTSYPEYWQEREAFFDQVREALQADRLLRVLLVIREDFLARIEPYMRQLKSFQQTRFRLALLGPDGARSAITGPLRGTGRHFKEGVVDALIEELLKVRVETAEGKPIDVVGEYVEPVQLQVVCRNLWKSLPARVQEISSEHLKAYGDVDQALKDFYETCLAGAKAIPGTVEPDLRQWFEEQLITPAGTRGIVFRGVRTTAALLNLVVDFLEDQHLIRGEWRAGARWYELTHDRFIKPIQRANEQWRARRRDRRNRLIIAGVGVILTILVAYSSTVLSTSLLNVQQSATNVAVTRTAVVVEAQATAQQEEAEQAKIDAARSKSRQLAAEALLTEDPDLALLLAIEANRQLDESIREARESLQNILSRPAVVDGKFLRQFDPKIISPKLVKRLEAHDNWVVDLAFSPDGRRFVSGSADTTLILWDVATSEPVFPPLSEHSSNILSVAYSPDGALIASAGLDSQIFLWDTSTGERIGALSGHMGLVTSVTFSPDGKRLASGGVDGTIRIWDIATREALFVTPPIASVWSLAWSPDGKVLASGDADGIVRLWETGKFSENRQLKGHRGLVRGLAWSPDGSLLVSGSVILNDKDDPVGGEVILWDVQSGEVIARPLREDSQPVRTVAFHPGGNILAIGRDDFTITLWDVQRSQVLGDSLKGHDLQVYAVAFSPDGRYMISGGIDQTIILWDLFAATESIAFSPTGDILAASEGSVISLWDPADNTTPMAVLSGHGEEVLALTFSPDGSVLASAGRDDTIRLWDANNGEPVSPPLYGHKGDVLTLDFSPDGSILASAGQDGRVLLWDVATLQQLGESLIAPNNPVIKVQFDSDGQTLYVADRVGNLITLTLESGVSQGDSLPALQVGHSITSLAFNKDGQKVAFFEGAGTLIPLTGALGRAHGIEISFWNESFDPNVNPEDIDFIVVLATNGDRIDPKFEEYLQPIQIVPIRGATHFYQPDQPWQEQADLFLSTVKDKGFHFFTLDVEIAPGENSPKFASDIQQWLAYVDERVNQKILLQTGTSFYNFWLAPSGEWVKDWPLLIMAYPFEPDRNGSPFLPEGVADWKIWEYTDGRDKAAEYGVGGDSVYLDVYNGTPLEMWEWLEIPAFLIYDRRLHRSKRPTQAIRETNLNSIAFSPDGDSVAFGGGHTVALMEVQTGAAITSLTSSGRKVTSLSFQPNGVALAIGTDDGKILLWDLGLIYPETELEPYFDLACSRVKRNFTIAELKQFFDDLTRDETCPDLN